MPKIDPRDFLLNTDYEMDKIIYFASGTLNAGQYDIDLPHTLGFAPLLFGVCAFNEDFSDSRGVPFNYTTRSATQEFRASANSSVVRVSYISTSGSPNKIYYRLYGFEPADSRAKVGATSKYAKNFILNTDYNYCKLFKKGVTPASSTIDHNLGYLPQVLAWQEANGWITPVEQSSTSASIRVTDQSVLFLYPALGTDRLHYRIYYDEV